MTFFDLKIWCLDCQWSDPNLSDFINMKMNENLMALEQHESDDRIFIFSG